MIDRLTLSEIWQAGSEMLAAGKRHQFIDYTSQALRSLSQRDMSPAFGVQFDRLIFTCQQLKDPREVAERCASVCAWDFERNGETAWGLLGRAVGAMAEGDLTAADAYIALSAGKPVCKRAAIALGVFNHRSPHYLARLYLENAQPSSPSTFAFEPAHSPRSDDIIHLVSCDSGYLHQFAAPAFHSSRAAGNAIFHLHIVNPDAEDLEFAQALARNPEDRLNISTERAPFLDALTPGKERSGYLINPRFIQAPQLLDFYDRPLFVSDIDAAITAPWDEIKAALAPYDVGIRRVAGHYPWRRNAAGCSYFAPTKNGKLFAQLVSLYIRTALDLTTHKINWLIDQNALFCAERTTEMIGASLKALAISTPQNDYTRQAQHFDGGKEAFKALVAL